MSCAQGFAFPARLFSLTHVFSVYNISSNTACCLASFRNDLKEEPERCSQVQK